MKQFRTAPGLPLPFGTSITPEGVNFSIFSRHATQVWLLLFSSPAVVLPVEIPLDPSLHRTGDIWHVLVQGEGAGLIYGFRMAGPHDPYGRGLYFNPDRLLIDPYARALVDGETWGLRLPAVGGGARRRALVVSQDFDWRGDRPLRIALKDSVIYELHVRGYTRHPSAGVTAPGTFRGLAEKIPYLRELGITAVELLPVVEFDECEIPRQHPATSAPLLNLWGYSPICFFSPKASYAADGRTGGQVREFKEMVRSFHEAGIEVILDVVFNHTAEGGWDGPVYNFRGMDNSVFYLLDQETRQYRNFSGCGNTINCNHPLVRELILDCLRYWVVEMHVDGFRFDLASILGRGQNGEVLSNPPMVEKIAEDPVLAGTKIIAEAWDAAGLYQVGSFSTSSRWAEWNGRFRDDVRRFAAGEGSAAELATRIAGSADLYHASLRQPHNSINFVTSHDGFSLHDLVSYNERHNEDNGEYNQDGDVSNHSWNSGVEGESEDAAVSDLRQRRQKTMAVILFLSQGAPMLTAGDEFSRTQRGNNNAYCQDNDISWIDWTFADSNQGMLRFVRGMIHLRRGHAIFRRHNFFAGSSVEEISWQTERPGIQDWRPENRVLAFHLLGASVPGQGDDDFFVMFNGQRESSTVFVLPAPPMGTVWRRIIDTALPAPFDLCAPEEGASCLPGERLPVAALAAVVLVSRPTAGSV